MRPLSRLLLLAALAAPSAHADWLDLPDGLYDISLSCAPNKSTIPCPSSFHASLAISGAGASAMSTSFNNQSFSGDPTDSVYTVAAWSSERSRLVDLPFSFIYLAFDLSATNPEGLSPRWWLYCSNNSSNTCTPVSAGNWAATAVSPVPEASTVTLIALGLASLAALQRRRRPSTGAIHEPR